MPRLPRLTVLGYLLSATLVTAAFAAPAREAVAADALLAQAVADVGPAAVTPEQAADAQRAAEQAELDLAVGAVRVGYLKAQARLLQGRPADAIAVAEASLAMIERLPDDVDRAALAAPLLELRAAAAPTPPVPGAPVAVSPPPAVQRQVYARPQSTESGEPDGPYERFLQRGGRSLDASDQADREYTLDRLGENPNIETQVFSYPSDWEPRSRGRERFRDGRIYASPEFRGENGELRQTVIYDVGALIHEAPYFTDAPQLDLAVATRTMLDREALRRGSQIFNGYPSDLAAGIPLLYFFGGVEEGPIRTPRGSEARMDELSHLIQQVIDAR
jgi:hypothetical protein